MPNFGDFNFNDDANSVDTDPTPDNIGPVMNPVQDGVQDDKTNYVEPGAGDQHGGGDPSVFAINSNPEEPQAQQDSITPIRKLIKKGTPRSSSTNAINEEPEPIKKEVKRKRRSKYLPEEFLPLDEEIDYGPELHYTDPIDHSIENVLSYLTGKNLYQKGSPSGLSRKIDKIIQAWEVDNSPKSTPDDDDYEFSLSKFINRMMDDAPWSENMLRYFIKRQKQNEAEQFDLDVSEIEDTALEQFSSLLNDTGPWSDRLTRYFTNRQKQRDADLLGIDIVDVSDTELQQFSNLLNNRTPWFQAIMRNSPNNMASQILLASGINEDILDENIITDATDAEPVNNPTGIGEMFNRTIISGPLDMRAGSIAEDGFSFIEAAMRSMPEPMQMEVTGIEGLEAVDFFNLLESSLGYDFNDYLGDLTEKSDIIEFQNIGDSALENFDGLL